MVEEVNRDMLQHNKLPSHGPLIKSLSGELSNLRWDLPLAEYHSYFSGGRSQGEWQMLADLTRGLAGCGPVPR